MTPQLAAEAKPMTPTPEATEALRVVLAQEGFNDPHLSWRCHYPEKGEKPCDLTEEAAAILAALPPGTVLTTVPDVARRLHGATLPWHRLTDGEWTACVWADDHRAEAKRLLGVTE